MRRVKIVRKTTRDEGEEVRKVGKGNEGGRVRIQEGKEASRVSGLPLE